MNGDQLPQFEVGDRVLVIGHRGFPDGITGTICMPYPWQSEGGRDWDGCRLILESEWRVLLFYFVEFDEPHDDGSGDGPYRSSEIMADYLRRIE